MVPLGQGGQSRRVKIAGLIVFVLALLTALGGCTWIQNWLNPNHAPVAVITASATSGEAPFEVSFDASQSYDPDGDQITYKWDFGDGSTGEGEVVQHGFGSAGSYTVQLQVTDNKGKSDTASKLISVSQPSNEVTKQQTFDAQNGVTYDTGTGLKVSIPPAPTSGTTKLVVKEDPTPQQPAGGLIELGSVYSISLVQEASSQSNVASQSELKGQKVKLTFDIPSGVDPHAAIILEWTDEGWVPVGSDNCLGGTLSPDERHIYADPPLLGTYAEGVLKQLFEAGDTVVVTGTKIGLKIRELHDKTPGDKIKTVPDGWVLKIIDPHPVLAKLNGVPYLWWKVADEDYEPAPIEGWVAEGLTGKEFLKKVDIGSDSLPNYFTSASAKYWIEHAAARAIDWASSNPRYQHSPWKKGKITYCLRFVTEAYEGREGWYSANAAIAERINEFYGTDYLRELINRGHFEYAYAEGKQKKDRIKKLHTQPPKVYRNPPKGALVFFSSVLKAYGHVGLYLGNGKVADIHADGKAYEENLTDVCSLTYIYDYLGWMLPPQDWLIPSPQPISPGSYNMQHPEVIGTLTPTLKWEEVPDADCYAIFVSTPGKNGWKGRSLVFDSKNQGIRITGNSYKLPLGILKWGKNYRWNIEAHFQKGWGFPSDERLYFQTLLNAPPDQHPTVTITSPADGSTFNEGALITFQGSATDPEDGDLTDSSLVWTSSIDGQIGTGESFARSDLSLGTHTITLTATDSHGAKGTASITIIINRSSPPGSTEGEIAFVSTRDGITGIYVMNVDGSDQRNITNNPAGDGAPVWSPDGTKIAFVSDRDGNYEIYVMNADGSNQHNITNNPANDYAPSWSPDGTKIAFSSDRDGNYEIYVMNADGSDQHNITNNPANDYAPSWSPDGTKIAFVSDRDGNYEIYVMNADGSNQHNITNNPAYDYEPAWSPVLP